MGAMQKDNQDIYTNTTASAGAPRGLGDALQHPLPTEAQMGLWLFCLSCFLVILNQGSKAIYNLRGKPTPQELTAANSALDSHLDGNETKIQKSIERIHERIDTVAVGVAEITGALKYITKG